MDKDKLKQTIEDSDRYYLVRGFTGLANTSIIRHSRMNAHYQPKPTETNEQSSTDNEIKPL